MITQDEYRFIQFMEEQTAEDSADPQTNCKNLQSKEKYYLESEFPTTGQKYK